MRMSDFDSLTSALEGWFDTSLRDLPDVVRQRVMRDFIPMPWDSLSADERRSVALQWDYQHDSATERERQQAWDRNVRMDEIKQNIAVWEQVSTPTASDLSLKESQLVRLREEFSQLKSENRIARRNQSVRSTGHLKPAKPLGNTKYLPYLIALRHLTERIAATPEEVAAWISWGPVEGGIAAYLNANELDPPPRFFYSYVQGQSHDYIAPLMACWFREEDIVSFEPAERYITWGALIERWSKHPAIRPESYIRAKIAESRLMDFHPICGGTQATFSREEAFPPPEAGLFLLSHVEEIEASEFHKDGTSVQSPINPCRSVNASQVRQHFAVIKSDADANAQWWKQKMRDAFRNGLAECRVGGGKKGPGGSLWRPDLVAGWLVDRHAKGRDGLGKNAVHAALKRFTGCSEVADDLFPPDE